MRPVTVRVTEEHIAQGRPRSNVRGPVALAMSEATGCTCYVSGVAVSVPGRFHCPTQRWLAGMLDGFDRCGAMDPFEFVLAGERGARRIGRVAGHEQAAREKEIDKEATIVR